jgi:hypothetical protein
MLILLILACRGEPSERGGSCRSDAACIEGLVCVKGSIVESDVHTCQIPCDAQRQCPRIPGEDGACSFCRTSETSSGDYCVATGCS